MEHFKFMMNSPFLMILTSSFLLFGFLKFANDRGICLKKCLIVILLLSAFAYWHFYSLEFEDKNYYPASNHQAQEIQRTSSIKNETETHPQISEEKLFNDKWIVVTSTSYPIPQIEKLSQIAGWKVVFVAGSTMQSNWTCSGVIMLDIATQLSLGFHIMEHLPYNSNSRKAIGYLFAMKHGARVIYDAELDRGVDNFSHLAVNDGNSFDGKFPFDASTTRSLLLSRNQGGVVVNPYNHFGQGSTYPRGFPWQQLLHQEFNNTYTVCPNISVPLIQQGVVGGYGADVDAYWRVLKETELKSPINVQLDPSTPPVILPSGVFAPFNSRSTIYHYAAFWGLVLPISLPNRVSDVWRGYWTQRLLWMINGHLGFFMISQNSTNSQEDGKIRTDSIDNIREEVPIHTHCLRLIQLLSEWNCPQNVTNFYDCMNNLSETLAQNGAWSSWDDVALIQAWIKDLHQVGYKEPEIVESFSSKSTSPCDDEKGESFAVFYPVEIDKIQTNQLSRRQALREFCNFTDANITPNRNLTEKSPQVQFPSTLLVVTFNEIARCKNIWLLDLIYRSAYPNIVYCVPFHDAAVFKNLSFSPEFRSVGVSQFSVVSANITGGGNFAYECTLRAIEMNYGVSEYFILQDDVLLNYWNNINFDKNEIWIYRSKESVLDTQVPYRHPLWSRWGWWRTEFGLNATKSALNEIYKLSDHPIVKLYRENREKFGYNDTVTMYGETDSYHVPGGVKKEIFYKVGSILRKFEVYMEIGVHLILSGISSRENVAIFPGISLWGGERSQPLKYFNASSSVIHPVKLSRVISSKTFRAEYCDKYVRHVLKME